MTQAIFLGATIVSTAGLTVLGALAIFAGLFRVRRDPVVAAGALGEAATFLFRDGRLLDCSDRGSKLLATLLGPKDNRASQAWDALSAYLIQRFPDFDTAYRDLLTAGRIELHSTLEEGLMLTAQYHRQTLQVTLNDTRQEGALMAMDRLSFSAVESELKTLRAVAAGAPALIWKTDQTGQIVWANPEYVSAVQGTLPPDTDLSWPLPSLMPDAATSQDGRVALQQDDGVRWFAYSTADTDQGQVHFALPVDAAVQSEVLRRENLQTLTRIFASLPIGLALFDAERRLQVFNPALVDLTRIDPLALVTRPGFEQFLHMLREKRMLPEPKDFHSWRQEIMAMEKAAESGEYMEEWCLNGGRTFQVRGRPQPNGAIALFIEDVTTEATLTRNFRSEIEVMHQVLDALDEPVAVFGLSGQALVANSPYVEMWEQDPCGALTPSSLADAIAVWTERCEPSAFWHQLHAHLADPHAPDAFSGTVALRTGQLIAVQVQRLPGGAIKIGFHQVVQSLLMQRPDFAIQAELIRAPDYAGMSKKEPGPGAFTLEASPLPRKNRTARHAGTRLRA